MNNKVVAAFAFVAGAAVGVAGTWKFAMEKYKRIAQEEIDSVKEVFGKMHSDEEKTVEDEPETDISEYKETVSACGYSEEKGEPAKMIKPYVISPDEFGEDGYPTVSFTYYADKVVVDEDYKPVENVDEVIGLDSLTHFGEYEDDSVFVRNDDLKLDFEILLDTRNYSDVIKNRMRRV